MSRHPLVFDFALDHERLGPSAKLSKTQEGIALLELLLGFEPVAALIGAIDAAPKRPPLPALDRYVLPHLGERATEDQYKILIGRYVRQIVEWIGGKFVRNNVPITVMGIHTVGSTYEFAGRGEEKSGSHYSAAERNAWVKSKAGARSEA